MEKMLLTEEEKKELKPIKNESDWYKACDKIKKRRNGQYPSYLAREILEMYQQNFPAKADDQK
jgi:hypothetical protein|tara:strand:+ start:249 stop:437 length:189 start_codon:yes stop_codon:yes gene_type:complete